MINNMLKNGMTLLQVNPDCAVMLDITKDDYGWLYVRDAKGEWSKYRKLPEWEIELAYEQMEGGQVKQGTKVREG